MSQRELEAGQLQCISAQESASRDQHSPDMQNLALSCQTATETVQTQGILLVTDNATSCTVVHYSAHLRPVAQRNLRRKVLKPANAPVTNSRHMRLLTRRGAFLTIMTAASTDIQSCQVCLLGICLFRRGSVINLIVNSSHGRIANRPTIRVKNGSHGGIRTPDPRFRKTKQGRATVF